MLTKRRSASAVRSIGRPVVLACVLAGVAPAAASAAAFSPVFSLGTGPGAGALAVGPDRTAYLAEGSGRTVKLWIRRANGTLLKPRRFSLPSGYLLTSAAPGGGVRNTVATVAAGSGWVVVAWEGLSQHPPTGTQVRVQAVRCTTTACGRVQTVYSGAGSEAAQLKTAAVGKKALLLWLGFKPSGLRPVHWALSDATGRYPAAAHTIGGASGDAPSLTATVHGRAVAAWVNFGPAGHQIELAQFDGHSFGSVTPAPGPAGADPHLAVAGGDVLLAWRDGSGDAEGFAGSGSVYVSAQTSASGGFGPAQKVLACSCRDLTLAAYPAGRAVLSFEDLGTLDASGNPTGPITLVASLREPHAAFAPPTTLTSSLAEDDAATATVDAPGNATVAWSDQGTIYATQATPTQPFATPLHVAAGRDPIAAPLGNATLLAWARPTTSSAGPLAPAGYAAALGP